MTSHKAYDDLLKHIMRPTPPKKQKLPNKSCPFFPRACRGSDCALWCGNCCAFAKSAEALERLADLLAARAELEETGRIKEEVVEHA